MKARATDRSPGRLNKLTNPGKNSITAGINRERVRVKTCVISQKKSSAREASQHRKEPQEKTDIIRQVAEFLPIPIKISECCLIVN